VRKGDAAQLSSRRGSGDDARFATGRTGASSSRNDAKPVKSPQRRSRFPRNRGLAGDPPSSPLWARATARTGRQERGSHREPRLERTRRRQLSGRPSGRTRSCSVRDRTHRRDRADVLRRQPLGPPAGRPSTRDLHRSSRQRGRPRRAPPQRGSGWRWCAACSQSRSPRRGPCVDAASLTVQPARCARQPLLLAGRA
jgi:hypothetical protein